MDDYREIVEVSPDLFVAALDDHELADYIESLEAGFVARSVAQAFGRESPVEFFQATGAVDEIYELARHRGYPNTTQGIQANMAAQQLDNRLVQRGAYEQLDENNIDWDSLYGHRRFEVSSEARIAANLPRAPNVRAMPFTTNMRKVRAYIKPFWVVGSKPDYDGDYLALEWYNGMFQWFVKILGNEADARIFVKLLAATSPQESVVSNLSLAIQCFQYYKAGVPLPKAIVDRNQVVITPGLMVSHYPNAIRAILDKPLSGPKVFSFTENMMGDTYAVTIDTWMLRALGARIFETESGDTEFINYLGLPLNPRGLPEIDDMGKIGRRGNLPYRYAYIANVVRQIAKYMVDPRTGERGVPPRDYQAATWTGIKILEDGENGLSDYRVLYESAFGKKVPPIFVDEQKWEKAWPPAFAARGRSEGADMEDATMEAVAAMVTDADVSALEGVLSGEVPFGAEFETNPLYEPVEEIIHGSRGARSECPVMYNPVCKAVPDVEDYEGMRVRFEMKSGLDWEADFSGPEQILAFAQHTGLVDDVRERLYAIYTNQSNRPLGYRLVSTGGVSQSISDARVIFGPALILHASSVILVHNHPGGRLKFSPADKALFHHLEGIAKSLEMRILDFLVVVVRPDGRQDYTSARTEGI